MSYITMFLNWLAYSMTTIFIPFPVSSDNVIYISIMSLFLTSVALATIFVVIKFLIVGSFNMRPSSNSDSTYRVKYKPISDLYNYSHESRYKTISNIEKHVRYKDSVGGRILLRRSIREMQNK